MKILAAAVLALVAAAPDVRFESGGVRIGNALVEGRVLELQSTGAASLLVSGASVESLASSLAVELTAGRILTLDPGVRVTRVDGGFRLSTHGERRVRLTTADGSVESESPALLEVRGEGWVLGELTIQAGALRAAVAGVQQDDTDANLERMKESAKKIRPGDLPKLGGRKHRLYTGSPLTPGQAADSISVRQILQLSPSGSP